MRAQPGRLGLHRVSAVLEALHDLGVEDGEFRKLALLLALPGRFSEVRRCYQVVEYLDEGETVEAVPPAESGLVKVPERDLQLLFEEGNEGIRTPVEVEFREGPDYVGSDLGELRKSCGHAHAPEERVETAQRRLRVGVERGRGSGSHYLEWGGVEPNIP